LPKLPRIPSLIVIKALLKAGFYEYHQSGSHIQLRHRVKLELRVTVPFHRKELTPKTMKTIIKQASLTIAEFINLL